MHPSLHYTWLSWMFAHSSLSWKLCILLNLYTIPDYPECWLAIHWVESYVSFSTLYLVILNICSLFIELKVMYSSLHHTWLSWMFATLYWVESYVCFSTPYLVILNVCSLFIVLKVMHPSLHYTWLSWMLACSSLSCSSRFLCIFRASTLYLIILNVGFVSFSTLYLIILNVGLLFVELLL